MRVTLLYGCVLLKPFKKSKNSSIPHKNCKQLDFQNRYSQIDTSRDVHRSPEETEKIPISIYQKLHERRPRTNIIQNNRLGEINKNERIEAEILEIDTCRPWSYKN